MENIAFAIFGVIIGWVASQYRLVIAENANIISDHMKDMESFSDSIQEYWLRSTESSEKETVMSSKVRAKHAAIGTFYGESGKRLTLSRLRSYQVLQVELFKTAMGGDFETADRGLSPMVAIESQRLCSEIIQELRLARREQISLKVAFTKIWCFFFPPR